MSTHQTMIILFVPLAYFFLINFGIRFIVIFQREFVHKKLCSSPNMEPLLVFVLHLCWFRGKLFNLETSFSENILLLANGMHLVET